MAAVELYGAEGSGSIAVEAALTLLQLPTSLIEGATWAHESARERVAPVNAMRQVPTLILPDGEIMTESAAILIDLADRHPAAGLAPAIGDPRRRQFSALDGLRFLRHLFAALDQAGCHPHRCARRIPATPSSTRCTSASPFAGATWIRRSRRPGT